MKVSFLALASFCAIGLARGEQLHRAPTFQCSNYAQLENVVIADEDIFDYPCVSWTEVDCGGLNETNKVWQEETCRYDGFYPNGFRTALIYGHNQPSFFLNLPKNLIDGTDIRIMLEAETPDANICIKAADYNPTDGTDAGSLAPTCGIFQLNKCFPAPSKDLILEIYCGEGCDNSISLKYKVLTSTPRSLVPGESSAVDTVAMWCEKESMDTGDAIQFKTAVEFPSEMTSIPPLPETMNNANTYERETSPSASTNPTIFSTLVCLFLGLVGFFMG